MAQLGSLIVTGDAKFLNGLSGTLNGNASTASTASALSGFTNYNNTPVNCDNVTTNGHMYYNTNGPTTALGASTGDGALYTQVHSSPWMAQIAQDYRNGNLFTRGKNNGTWQVWRKVRYMDDTVAVANGGTGATTAANARTNLGIGSVGTLNYGTGTNTFLLNNGTWSTVVLPVNPSTKPTAVGAMWIET